METYQLTVNGQKMEVTADPSTPKGNGFGTAGYKWRFCRPPEISILVAGFA